MRFKFFYNAGDRRIGSSFLAEPGYLFGLEVPRYTYFAAFDNADTIVIKMFLVYKIDVALRRVKPGLNMALNASNR
jgi:hypothetical protein